MPTMTVMNQSVAANAVSANLLSGKNYEFLPFNALIEIFATSAATGLNVTVIAGQDIAVNDEDIGHISAVLEVLQNQHLVDDFDASAGTQLRVTFRNSTATAIIGNLLVKITPI